MLTLCLPVAGIQDEEAVAIFGVEEKSVVGRREADQDQSSPRSSAR
jgi:hypothetical protein